MAKKPSSGENKAAREKALLELKEILLAERQKIVQQLESLEKNSQQDVQELSGDSVDYASIEISQNAISKLGTRQQKLLDKILHALSKFDDGTYGVCELTGEDIPVERLRARPVAQYTVEAKEELERREKLYATKGDSSSEEESWDIDQDE
jgi:DnaK suppressor protein